jgi:thiamine phosphate synthase YjbQ (UPF0047 family)
VRADLEAFFEHIAPEDPGRYAHDNEGPDDMSAHLRTALTQVQPSIPLLERKHALGTWHLALGTWQGAASMIVKLPCACSRVVIIAKR